jgi:predicted RNA-binding Zn ribbon-like protein
MTAGVALHDLGHARDILDEWLDEAEGEATPELEQLMAELDVKADEKIVNVALYIREQLATAIAIDAEVERLVARAKARKNAADRLKRYLEAWMVRLEKTKIVDARCTVALQKNPPSVKGDLTPEVLMDLYGDDSSLVRYKPATYELDRRAALELHKAGESLPVGLTVEQSSSLRIR